jgi:Ser/Thr protein kinase RdoA (MazF antagonist)
MAMRREHKVSTAARQFQIKGEFISAEPYGNGHINDTYRVVFQDRGVPALYILQRINNRIFKEPAALMENIRRVVTHLAPLVAKEPDWSRRALRLIPTHDGAAFHVDPDGNYWRAYFFILHATTYDVAENTEHAFQAARAFGRFQKMLASLAAPRLYETIPDFHNTPKRFRGLLEAIASDAVGRAVFAKPEIEFAVARESIVSVLLDVNLPERVTHNDTKLNNVMLDDATGEGICVIDLDTVMPGLALYDFGDMVRTTTSPAKEDGQNLSLVTMQFPMFEALVRGYLTCAGSFLTKAEKRLLAFSGKLITFEIGMRFLTDYLAGDTYFKVHRKGHNLDRCRTQFKLVESIEQQEARMERLVESIEAGH